MHFKDVMSDSWGCAQRINDTNGCGEEVTLVSACVREFQGAAVLP